VGVAELAMVRLEKELAETKERLSTAATAPLGELISLRGELKAANELAKSRSESRVATLEQLGAAHEQLAVAQEEIAVATDRVRELETNVATNAVRVTRFSDSLKAAETKFDRFQTTVADRPVVGSPAAGDRVILYGDRRLFFDACVFL
jgi:uncharacterized protein YPO0396